MNAWDGREIGHRIMDRQAPFGQSHGHWELGNVGLRDLESEAEVSELILMDWYHAFLDTRFPVQLAIFALAYFIGFCSFALVFLVISEPCGLELHGNFIRAYLLSLETLTTIGYGVPDPYMKGCWQAPVLLTVQCLGQLLMSACLVSIVFQRISRPQARASTIIFSDQAVIRRINGAYYFMLRIADLRCRHSLVEAHVRCYCMHRHPVRGYQFTPLRTEHPDDSFGGNLLLTLPTVIVHRIDAWSPLAPPASEDRSGAPSHAARSKSATSQGQFQLRQDREHHRRAGWPAPLQRQVDCEAGTRCSCICPVCGESFNTAEHLELHCRYNMESDETCDLQPGEGHAELSREDLQRLAHMEPTADDLKRHLDTQFCEVVVLVEGIEATTSATLQARHSYVVGGLGPSNDVAWDMDFMDCVRVPHGAQTGLALNLGRFHSLTPAAMDEV